MPAFDFPSPAAVNQTVTMPDGTQRSWDGTKWRQAGLAPGPYLPLSGGSLQGPLVLAADPTSAMQAATKEYVDAEALNNTGRSLVHNGTFVVQQRGTGPWTATNNYTADRWVLGIVNDTVSATVASLADADRSAIGDESALFGLQIVFTGSVTAGSLSDVAHRLENVRRFSGKAVVLSFWARATSGTPRLAISMNENFGTGGSPSTGVVTVAGQTPALSGTWTRYTLSTTLPSAAGKVFGTTAGTDFLNLVFYLSDQSGGSGIGVQSGTIQLWGVQLELGTVATPLAKRDPADELSLCQRFYSTGYGTDGWYSGAASGYLYATTSYPVTMRAAPSVTLTPSGGAGYSGVTVGGAWAGSFLKTVAVSATGSVNYNYSFTASADL